MQKLVQREKEIESMKGQFEELKKTQDQMIKTSVNMQRLEDWINQYSDENLFSNIETMIWEYLDPEEDGTVSREERIERRRQFPELVKAAKRLQKLRLASKNI